MKFLILSIFTILCIEACAKEQKFYIAEYKNENCGLDLILVKEENNESKLLYQIECPENTEEFYYDCYIRKDNYELIIFSQYSSLAGLKKILYYDLKNNVLYSTDFLNETKIPLYLSVEIDKKTISVFDMDFGEISLFSLKSNSCENDINIISKNDYKIIKTITP